MHLRRLDFIHYLRGQGIEIGALNCPLPLPSGVTARYSDTLSREQIEALYPGAQLPDIFSDSETFPTLPDNSEDFIIANHVLEHVTNPIGALTEWYRVLKDEGILFLTLPDKRVMFDRDRKRTSLAHLIGDDSSNEDPQIRNLPHLEEWATHVEKLAPNSPSWTNWVDEQKKQGYSVHNHVWISRDILQLLRYLRRHRGVKFRLLDFADTPLNDIEFILILRAQKRPQKLFAELRAVWRSNLLIARETVLHFLRWSRIPGVYCLAKFIQTSRGSLYRAWKTFIERRSQRFIQP